MTVKGLHGLTVHQSTVESEAFVAEESSGGEGGFEDARARRAGVSISVDSCGCHGAQCRGTFKPCEHTPSGIFDTFREIRWPVDEVQVRN